MDEAALRQIVADFHETTKEVTSTLKTIAVQVGSLAAKVDSLTIQQAKLNELIMGGGVRASVLESLALGEQHFRQLDQRVDMLEKANSNRDEVEDTHRSKKIDWTIAIAASLIPSLIALVISGILYHRTPQPSPQSLPTAAIVRPDHAAAH
jgi:hypothetical protein